MKGIIKVSKLVLGTATQFHVEYTCVSQLTRKMHTTDQNKTSFLIYD